MQIVVNVLEHGLDVDAAIAAPRVHVDEPHVHCEGGHDPAELDRLEALGYDVVRWRRRNLFFGGAAAVEVLADGSLAAAGDPRRGGAGVSSWSMTARRPTRPQPGDAAGARRARERGRGEPEGWLLADSRWRSVADERRYIRALQRHPDAALSSPS